MLDVLLIDDDARIQAALSTRLKASGMSVRQSFNGFDGLDEVRRAVPDLIVLDVRMPGLSGIEVCRELRKIVLAHHTPVVFVSAETCPKTRADALEAGGACFIEKPYDSGQLIKTIKKLAA